MGENEYFVNGNLGNFGQGERYSSCKSKNSEGREVPVHSGYLDSPQPLLSGAIQGFEFYIGELDIIEVVLDSFDRALCSIEGESNRFDFW